MLPPLVEQRRIVAKIDHLMSICNKLEAERDERNNKRLKIHTAAINKLLSPSDKSDFNKSWNFITRNFKELYSVPENVEELKKAILQLAVMGKLVRQDPNDQPASELLKEIEAEKMRLVKKGKIKKIENSQDVQLKETPYEVPRGWKWIRLGDLVYQSEAGKSPNCENRPAALNECGILKISAISWDEFDDSQNKVVPSSFVPDNEHEVKVGDFIISRANTAELVAKSVVVKKTRSKLYLCDKTIRLHFCTLVNKEYANVVNNSTNSRYYYAEEASGTSSSMKNVSRQTILRLPFPLPPIAEQKRIVKKVDQLFSLCQAFEQSLTKSSEKQTAILNAVLARM
jgi:type I restriction enzyme S subunit